MMIQPLVLIATLVILAFETTRGQGGVFRYNLDTGKLIAKSISLPGPTVFIASGRARPASSCLSSTRRSSTGSSAAGRAFAFARFRHLLHCSRTRPARRRHSDHRRARGERDLLRGLEPSPSIQRRQDDLSAGQARRKRHRPHPARDPLQVIAGLVADAKGATRGPPTSSSCRRVRGAGRTGASSSCGP